MCGAWQWTAGLADLARVSLLTQSILESGCGQSCTHLLQRHFTLVQCVCHCHGRTWARANRVALHCPAATASAPVVWSHQHYCTDGLTVGGSIPKPRSPEPVFFFCFDNIIQLIYNLYKMKYKNSLFLEQLAGLRMELHSVCEWKLKQTGPVRAQVL